MNEMTDPEGPLGLPHAAPKIMDRQQFEQLHLVFLIDINLGKVDKQN